ncbi:MAG: DUF5678 domain-containing protein, partial [Candidatus Nitrosocosmicus sp.]|nr:DUF5678 domain-containing protein [Candidatus Nitrosocosmicus sp.]
MNNDDLQDFVKNGEYLHRQYNELITKFNHQYIAIKNQKVFRHAKTMEELEKLLQKENIELGTILVEIKRAVSNTHLRAH